MSSDSESSANEKETGTHISKVSSIGFVHTTFSSRLTFENFFFVSLDAPASCHESIQNSQKTVYYLICHIQPLESGLLGDFTSSCLNRGVAFACCHESIQNSQKDIHYSKYHVQSLESGLFRNLMFSSICYIS